MKFRWISKSYGRRSFSETFIDHHDMIGNGNCIIALSLKIICARSKYAVYRINRSIYIIQSCEQQRIYQKLLSDVFMLLFTRHLSLYPLYISSSYNSISHINLATFTNRLAILLPSLRAPVSTLENMEKSRELKIIEKIFVISTESIS